MSCFVLLQFQAAAQNSFSEDSLISTDQHQHEVAASQLQHIIFIEEASVTSSNAKVSPDFLPHLAFFQVGKFNFLKPVTSEGNSALHFLQDRRDLALRLLYPFHFFF